MSTSLEQVRQPEVLARPTYDHIPSELQNWFDPAKFAQLQRIAAMFAASNQVPAHFRGDQASCAIALDMAFRMNISPMMALQNMYVVHGNPGISSQLAIALSEKAGVFDGPIDFEIQGSGDNLQVTAKAKLAVSKREIRLTVSYKQAMDAGWPRSKEGIKPFWKAMPEQMLRYRSAVFLIRTYAPSVIMGMHTKEEWEDQGDQVEARVDPGALLAQKIAQSLPPAVEHPAQVETKITIEKSKPVVKKESKPEPKPEVPPSKPEPQVEVDNSIVEV